MLTMYPTNRTSPTPIDSQSILPDDVQTDMTDSSTPELNILLDKLTEILRFRSACRRHYGQQNSSSTNNLKRLQSGIIEPLHHNTDVSLLTSTTGAWKASNIHQQSTISNRPSHHYPLKCYTNEKKRRLPCLLQRLIDEGNLIKEAVHRLKSQRFSPSQQQSNNVNTPSTPTTKSPFPILPNVSLTSANITIPQPLNDSPNQSNASPNLGLSWFLSSNVFATGNHTGENGSPRRTFMEIEIHDG